MKNTVIALIVITVGAIAGYYLVSGKKMTEDTRVQERVEAAKPVRESERPITEGCGNMLEKADRIRIENPRPNEVISSPLTIRGQARGTWYFEGDFPVSLKDGEGNEIRLEPPYVSAQGEWMTENFVPYEKTVRFELPKTAAGLLILHKDNPSGRRELDDQLIVPVKFE